MNLVIRDIRQVTRVVKSFILARVDGSDLPEHRPGAHLTLTLHVAGRVLTRRYSILSDTRDRGVFQIGVLRDPSGGIGSAHLHDAVRVGDELEVGGPHAELTLRSDAPHSVLIAGGIGITPMLSLLRALVAGGRSAEIHYASRHSDQCAFRDDVRGLAGDRARFYFRDLNQQLDVGGILGGAPSGAHVYICGPQSLIDSVRRAAAQLGYERGRVHFESFGPRWGPEDRPVELSLSRSGMTLNVDPGTTLLAAMLEAGVFAPYECKRGECATCVATVLEGDVDHRDLCLDDSQRANSLCTCVSWARGGRLTLDL